MEKTLSPVWFLEDPIDSEYKEYILLNFLKDRNKKIENVPFSVLKETSILVKALNSYKEKGFFDKSVLEYLGISEIKDLNNKPKDEKILKIVSESLNTLYRYSEICMEVIKDEEDKIKIFRIESGAETDLINKSGIVIIRNMISDDIVPYFFYSRITMKTSEGEKEIYIMKKCPISNMKFSMGYPYIYHEILEEYKIINSPFPSLYAIEIYENFNDNSEILKISKEKFLGFISDFKF